MDLQTIGTVVLAVLAFLAATGGGVAWFYRRGRDEQSLASSVARQAEATELNTRVTEMLAAQVGGLLEAHGNQLTEHHWRLKALEDRRLEVKITEETAHPAGGFPG
jgi:hypothetical protein